MSLFFFLNNLHFTLELLGALAFLMVGWLAFDAFAVRKDFITASRGVGFLLLSAGQTLHALSLNSESSDYLIHIFYLAGFLFVIINLILTKPVPRPDFKAVLIMPSIAGFLATLNFLEALLALIVSILVFRQYKLEFKKDLNLFWASFLLLSLGFFTAIFYKESVDWLWILGHLFEIAAFIGLIWWVWQYLRLRIQEEIVLIFISFTLFISMVITLAFSTILITQIENSLKASLTANTKVLDFAVAHLREEALGKAQFLAGRSEISEAFLKNDFPRLEKLLTGFLVEQKLGFLTLTDKNGDVVLRANALSKRDDNLSGEKSVSRALDGQVFATLESSPVEGFSVRASAPLISGKKVIGVIVAGFPLDNAFVDSIKTITGLEAAIFEGDSQVATTLFDADGRTRSLGAKITDEAVKQAIFSNRESITLRTEFLSRPFLVSYIPIINSDNSVEGVFSSAKPQQEVLEIANAATRLTLMAVISILLILITPIYLIAKQLSVV